MRAHSKVWADRAGGLGHSCGELFKYYVVFVDCLWIPFGDLCMFKAKVLGQVGVICIALLALGVNGHLEKKKNTFGCPNE